MTMRISFSPQRRDDKLTLSRSGASSVVVNGRSFNFTTVPKGAELPAEAIDSPWFAGPVTRVDGELRLCLILPVGPNASPEVAFPADIVDPPNGSIAVPEDPAPEEED